MATNVYFQSGNTAGRASEQKLVEDLVLESIRIYGHDVFYIPRTIVNRDSIFDEDALSEFKKEYPVEMYLEHVDGYEGEGDLFTRFGIEVRDSATFVLSKRRWDDLVSTNPGPFQLDTRPAEGDLLYFEKTGSLFQIKYVEFQNPFYQLGKIYVFKLQVELFDYSSENLDTGITDIDAVETSSSLDVFNFQFQLENGDLLKLENNDTLILENFSTQRSLANTDNADFDTLQNLDSIIDFSEVNPFGEI